MDQKLRKPPEDPDLFSSQLQSPELRPKLIKLAGQKGVPIDDCEDIVSEAIARAIANQEEYDRARGGFFSWISGITENVIRTYYRKLNTQKRKPNGGVISADAASASDEDNPRELADKSSEARRKSAEDAQHYIDTAGLSEKEQKAIASRLDKDDKPPAPKFGSSTARRALQKLKQVRTDEEFRESPQGPDSSECTYGNIPAVEGGAAILFDQLRRTPWFVHSITEWRESSQWKNAQAFLRSERDLKRFPLRIPVHYWSEELRRYREAAYNRSNLIYRRLEAAVEITFAFAEWPTTAYCKLGRNDRRKRLEEFGWRFCAEPFWEITEPTFEIFVQAADEPSEPIKALDQFLEFLNKSPTTGSHVYSSTHLIRIDWRYPTKTLMASFKRWVEKAVERDSGRIEQAGRPGTTNLVGFAGLRLVDDFGLSVNQAMSWLRKRYGGPMPKTPERLERAIKEVREELKDFLPSPAEIGA